MEITKAGAQSLQMKMQNAELNLKGAINRDLRVVAACSKITSDRLNCSHCFYADHRGTLS